MIIACHVLFGRIIWWATPLGSHRKRLLWCSSRFFVPCSLSFDFIYISIQLAGLCLLGSISPYSHLALDLHNTQQVKVAFAVLRIGLGLQLWSLIITIVLIVRYTVVSRRWANQNVWMPSVWAINFIIITILVRQAKLPYLSDLC